MARVTIEDCLDNVDNRFQLVLVATKRARQILLGGQPMVAEDNDKPTVLALREIAAGHVTRDILTQPDYQSADEWPEEEEVDGEANNETLLTSSAETNPQSAAIMTDLEGATDASSDVSNQS